MIHTPQPIVGNKTIPPIADHRSRVLILDSVPGEKSLILQQYYAHNSNHFWRIVFKALQMPYQTNYMIRKQLLLRHGIALWNVFENCVIKNINDNHLSDERTNDFQTFFLSYPTVNSIIFNGIHAANFYKEYVGCYSGITYTILPSTSALNTWKSIDEKMLLWTEEIQKYDQEPVRS